MAPSEDIVGHMANRRRVHATNETDMGKTYDGYNLWVPTPEGCLLVWEFEEASEPESFQEMRPKSV